MRKIIEETFGNTKVILEYNEAKGWIYADWIGVHSLHSIRKGTEAIVALFKQTGSSKYLSDNTNLIGSFDSATSYLVDTFTPKAMQAACAL
jgi:thiaminase